MDRAVERTTEEDAILFLREALLPRGAILVISKRMPGARLGAASRCGAFGATIKPCVPLRRLRRAWWRLLDYVVLASPVATMWVLLMYACNFER